MGNLTKNYLYNLAYNMFIMIVPLVTAPYLSRVLGEDNMGTASYIASVSSVISTICLLGLYNYGVRQIAYVRNDTDAVTKVFWEISALRVVMLFVASIAYFFVTMTSGYAILFFWYYAWFITSFVDVSWLFVGEENMATTVFKNFISKLLSVICIFLFVRKKTDLLMYIIMLAVPTLFANLSIIPQIKRYVKSGPNWSEMRIQRHIKPALLLFFPQVATILYLQVDKIMIQQLTNAAAQVAFYDQAEKIIKIPLTCITALSAVMMPRLANIYTQDGENSDKVNYYVRNTLEFSMLLAFPMMVGLIAVAKNLIPWYLGANFSPSIYAMWILSPIVITNSLSNIFGAQYFTALNKTRILTVSYVLAAAANIVVNSLLIPVYGYIGAAIATVISETLVVAVQYVAMRKSCSISKSIPCVAKYFVISCIMAIVVYPLQRIFSGPILTLMQIIVGVSVYFVLNFRDAHTKQLFSKANTCILNLLHRGK